MLIIIWIHTKPGISESQFCAFAVCHTASLPPPPTATKKKEKKKSLLDYVNLVPKQSLWAKNTCEAKKFSDFTRNSTDSIYNSKRCRDK